METETETEKEMEMEWCYGAERETRRGANVMYSGGDRLHSAQGEADFGNSNTPPGLVSGAGSCDFTVRTG